jgi:hypothetical protein
LGRFVTRGVKKLDLKNRGNFSAAAKKSTHSLTSLFGFFPDGAPCSRLKARKHQLESSAVLRPWISIGHVFLVPTSPLLFFNAWVFCSKRGTDHYKTFLGEVRVKIISQNNSENKNLMPF